MAKKKRRLVDELDSGESVVHNRKDVNLISSLRRQLAARDKIIDQQNERIDRLGRDRFEIPKQRAPSKKKGGFVRVIIPDTHGCFVDPAAISAVFSDIEQLCPREIILLGDHLDCGGFLAQHHTLGYVAEADYTFEQDVDAANVMLDRLQSICPRSAIHYLEGNHEARIEKWCLTSALRNKHDAKMLLDTYGTETQLHLAKRKISFYKQGQFYDGCRIPSTIKLGKCYFTHGSRVGKNATQAMLSDYGACVVFGHVHKIQSASSRTVEGGEIGAWTPGCLCRLQPLWRHTAITDWSHGYGVQLVRPDGDFLHITVPIIDGKSYLINLTEKISK